MGPGGHTGWAVVLGSSGAIGSAICSRLLDRGVPVAGLDMRKADRPVPTSWRTRSISEMLTHCARRCFRLLLVLARLDTSCMPLASTPGEDLSSWRTGDAQEVMSVDYVSAVEVCRVVVPAISDAGRGSIAWGWRRSRTRRSVCRGGTRRRGCGRLPALHRPPAKATGGWARPLTTSGRISLPTSGRGRMQFPS